MVNEYRLHNEEFFVEDYRRKFESNVVEFAFLSSACKFLPNFAACWPSQTNTWEAISKQKHEISFTARNVSSSHNLDGKS